MVKTEERVHITKRAKQIIEEAVNTSDRRNRYEICSQVKDILKTKYINTNQSRLISMMGLVSSEDILERIDEYMITKLLFIANTKKEA